MNLKDLNSLAQAIYKRHNPMTPLVLMCALLLAALVLTAPFSPPEWLLAGLFAVLCLSLLFFGGVYLYFMLKRPDKLHSEDYLLELRGMSNVFENRGEIELIAEEESAVERTNQTSGQTSEFSGGEGNAR